MRNIITRFLLALTISTLISGYTNTPRSAEVGKSQLNTPPAVSAVEQMKNYPSPGQYVAFSMKVAQKMIENISKGQNYRTVHPEVYNLGGMNQIHGMIYDRKAKDIILVGKYIPEHQPITLDDFAVAARAHFIHGKDPVVSIDPTENTKQTGMQHVRFEGGIENTQFGADLLDADYRLKRIGMGFIKSGIPGFKSKWDIGMELAKRQSSNSSSNTISSRFWFYPILPSVAVREDVVSIKGLTVGVFTEVLSAEIDGKNIEKLTTFQDEASDRFAKAVSENFEALEKIHPSFSRLRGLNELVALVSAIDKMREKPEINFWFTKYRIKHVKTQKELKVLKRYEKYEDQSESSVYRGYYEVSGGVHLIAIALRLKSGDVTALKEAVLTTRPELDTLSWSFIVGEWLIPTAPGMIKMEEIAPLFSQAVFLWKRKHYDEAVTLYSKIIDLKPDWSWPYTNRGLVYDDIELYDQAISDFTKAIEINPKDLRAYSNRGNAYDVKRQYDQAISDFTKAIEINPKFAEAYNNRGIAYAHKRQYDQAISDFTKAIEINPKYSETYNNRGLAYEDKGQYDQAISDYSKALEINPRNAKAYNNRGLAYEDKGQYDQAISDYNKALEINPRNAKAYYFRGNAYAHKRHYNQSNSDFTKAIEINPKDTQAYNHRGINYIIKEQYDRAISDFNKALEINPKHIKAYINRGNTYQYKGQYDRAISDFNKALEINPKDAMIYNNRGSVYVKKDQYERAISDYNKAIEINSKYSEAYNNRGLTYVNIGQYDQAISDFTKAIEINPKYSEAYNNRGFIYILKLGNNIKGCADWKKACELGKCGNYNLAKQQGDCF